MSGANLPAQSEKATGLATQHAHPVDTQPDLPHPEADLRKPKTEQPSILTRIQESWIAEFVALIVAAGAVAAIASLLSKYNQSELPSWNGVTLNSLVSWLSTIAGLCMAYVAGITIAQLKWVWFAQQARPVEDMTMFNDAGDLAGALQLLAKLRVRHFAVITLLAIIFAIGLDPFTQNLIVFYENNVVDRQESATVTRGRWYDTVGPPLQAYSYSPNPVLKANVDIAIAMLGQSTNASVPKSFCNTGNCTYPPFATLAYQATCVDVSDKIKKNCTEGPTTKDTKCEVYLGDYEQDSKFQLSYYNDTLYSAALMATRATTLDNSVSLRHLDSDAYYGNQVYQALRMNIPSSFEHISSVLNDTVTFVAQECAILPCVQSIEASVRNGVYAEKVLDTYTTLDPESSYASGLTLRPPWGPDKGIHPGDNTQFGISYLVTQGLASDNYPDRILEGLLVTQDAGAGLVFTVDHLQNIWYANVSNMETCSFTGGGKKDPFACAMKAVADAYTQTVRDAGYNANGTATSDGLWRGETLVQRTFVRVKWPWISLHVAVWVLTVVGWVGTVWKSKRMGIPFWRKDPMPMVYMYSAAQQQNQQSTRGAGTGSGSGSGSDLGMEMLMDDDTMMRLFNDDGTMRLLREA